MQEATDELEAFVIRDMCGRLLRERATIKIVREISLYDRRRHSRADGKGVDRHSDAELAELIMRHGLAFAESRYCSGLPAEQRPAKYGTVDICVRKKAPRELAG